MANEEAINQELTGRFPFLAGAVRIQRARRVFADVPYEHFRAVFETAVRELGFTAFSTLTGLDDGEQLSVIYHIGRSDGTLLNIKTSIPKGNPELASVSDMFPASVLYERELVDLLGFNVTGLPAAGARYPLQDDWPEGEHPLRKDWDAAVLSAMAAVKGGANG